MPPPSTTAAVNTILFMMLLLKSLPLDFKICFTSLIGGQFASPKFPTCQFSVAPTEYWFFLWPEVKSILLGILWDKIPMMVEIIFMIVLRKPNIVPQPKKPRPATHITTLPVRCVGVLAVVTLMHIFIIAGIALALSNIWLYPPVFCHVIAVLLNLIIFCFCFVLFQQDKSLGLCIIG